MPHFIIECSQDILQQKSPDEIMDAVYESAESTGLFAVNDIKVRLQPYTYFRLGDQKKTFCMFSDILWKAGVRSRNLTFQNRFALSLQHCFRKPLFCLSTSVNLKLQHTAIKLLSILKTKIRTATSVYNLKFHLLNTIS